MANILFNAAHQSPGPIAIAFSPDGQVLYTGGGDCVARVWKLSEGNDAEAAAIIDADEPLWSIAAIDQAWITASADSSVRLYNGSDNQLQSLILSGNAIPIRSIAADPTGQRVAIGSDELDVKVLDLKDPTKIQTLVGHKNGVRKVTWHPSSSYLTTSGQDGRIIVWDMSPENPVLVKSIEGIIPFQDPDSSGFFNDCSACWHPSGKYFFSASKTHEIVVVSRDTWTKSSSFPSADEISSDITALAVSPNGLYLASASKDGILIWSIQIKRVLFRHQIDSQSHVNQLIFSPTQNLLVWGDTEGNLYRWIDPIPPTQPPPHVDKSTKSARREKTPVMGDMEEDLGEDVDEDWIIDDMAGAGGVTIEGSKEKERSYAREIVAVAKAQSAFQPGSTPMKDRKGYLAYNRLGVVEVTDQDSHQIINVEFHDRSTYPSYHFTDYNRFNMASIGDRGIAYARPSEKSEPSQVLYKPYATWGSSTEWSITLPAGEDVIAIAAGGVTTRRSYKNRSSEEIDSDGAGTVVIATSTSYLRFFTGSGIQIYVWAMGGDIVSLVAGNEWVFVVYREGGTSLDGCQNLRYSLISLDRFEVVQDGQLPLPKNKTLKWIGISEEGAPSMYDSNGVLFVLDRFRRPKQARWVPILDTNTLSRRAGKDESYWPIGLSGKMFMCLILKGRTEHPSFPRPLVQELELRIPLLQTEQPQIVASEEKLIREKILLSWTRDALGPLLESSELATRELEMDKDLIKLLQAAIKDRQLQRANDIVRLLNHINSLDTAAKLAEYYHLVALQDKINSWKKWREENEDPLEEMEERRTWSRGVLPIPPSDEMVAHLLGNTASSGRPQEFKPASMFPKRSLVGAIPSYAQNVFARKSDQSTLFGKHADTNDGPSLDIDASQNYDEGYANAESSMPEYDAASSPPEGKRKRDAEDDNNNASYKKPRTGAPRPDSTVPSSNPGMPQQRKAMVAVPSNAKPNPFARTLAPNHSIVKSNTFFEKVDAAEAAAPSKRGAEKRQTKQTTLFGLPGIAPADKKAKAIKRSKAAETDVDSQPGPQTASVDAEGVEETQLTETPTDETQVVGQSIEETQDAGVMDEEPIEWPESPAGEPTSP
ncbi:hypothetical protein FRC15_004714 [Serendipita sp. 397]|nr:hypothetical protein FRC15_004714 [Serendipita sp. 397]